jgi:SAM-dependent methyltransferase
MNVMRAGSIYKSGEYLAHNPTWHVEDSEWKASKVLQALERLKIAPASLCDIGCGAGEVLRQLHSHLPVCKFTGYEISPQAYALAKERQVHGLEFHLTDILEPGEGRPHYDVALALDVFEHVADYYSFLTNMKGLADTKIFHIPLDWTIEATLRPKLLKKGRDELGHIHYFNKDTALLALENCGYQVLDWVYTPWLCEIHRPGVGRAMRKWVLKAVCAINVDLAVRTLDGLFDVGVRPVARSRGIRRSLALRCNPSTIPDRS